MVKAFVVRLSAGRRVKFQSASACAKEMLSEHLVPMSKIAEFTGLTPQTVLRIDETHGLRYEANPKYSKASA